MEPEPKPIFGTSIADNVRPIRKSLFYESPHSSSLYTSLPNNYRALRAERNHTPETDTNELQTNASNYGTGSRKRQTSNKSKSLRKSVLNDSVANLKMTCTQPYGILDESLPTDHSLGGLSNNLSTESIKNACEFYDDELSDDDLIEVQSTPECFQKQAPTRKSFTANCFNIEGRKKRKCSEENPLCALSPENKMDVVYTNATKTSSFTDDNTEKCQQDDEQALTTVLDELDAILDIHGASSPLNTSSSSAGNDGGIETKIEDCLLDLDNYLKDMDDCSVINFESEDIPNGQNNPKDHLQTNRRNMTLPSKRKTFPSTIEAEIGLVNDVEESTGREFQRSHALRKTISCALESRPKDSLVETSQIPINLNIANVWRRNSMRRTAPLAIPGDLTSQQSSEDITLAENDNVVNECQGVATDISAAIIENDIFNMNSTVHLPVSNELRRCFSQNDFGTRSSTSAIEMLTQENILNNLLAQNGSIQAIEDRPRQWGRRAEGHPRILSLRSNINGENDNSFTIFNHDQRPMSAPATASATGRCDENALRQERHTTFCTTLSEASSIRSSRNASPVSINSSSDSSSTAASTNGNMQTNLVGSEQLQSQNLPLDPENTPLGPKPGFNSEWPHGFSRTLALLCCSLGLFNICRFSVLTVQYGGNFLLQFLILSILFGVPLFWLQMCLGAKIRAGPVSMWKISPICRGIGIALVMVQCLIAIYSSVSISWLFVFLRDSFPSHTQTGGYRWQETLYPYYRQATNASSNLTECVADYFNIVVLQRLKIATRQDGGDIRFRVSDRLAFNLVILWAAVFLILCKGLKSFGKMIFPLFLLPLIVFSVVTFKLLYVVDLAKLQNIFAATDFDEFLINSKTWTAAAQEAFLTWGLLGPSVISISSRIHPVDNKKTTLRRDAILVVLVTFIGLAIAALFGLACIEILHQHSYIYAPGSYEQPESYTAVYSLKAPINANILSYPTKWVPHYSSLVGETYRRPITLPHDESGYQALRLISELFPAALALTRSSVSWIWAAVAFATFILFGLAQLCVMWKPISCSLGNSTSSVLLSCVTGLLLSIPFATEMGISILHYMDLLLGGSWFIPILWTTQIFGVFLIRGRPYNGDDLVNDLRMSGSMSAFLALSWNVLLPIGLITLAVVDYKTSLSNQFYYWRGKSYFSYWARKLAGLSQIAFLLLIPITAIIQIYRYLSTGPPDILDRIQLLYRPSEGMSENRRNSARSRETNGARLQNGNTSTNIDLNTYNTQDDAPPKYTPPPSYTTATGARLAKILRQSIRRSVRRILGEPGRSRPILPIDTELNQQSLPPDYSTVHTNPSGNIEAGNEPTPVDTTDNADRQPPSMPYAQRSLSLGRKMLTRKQHQHSEDLNGRPASAAASRTLERNSNAPQRLYTAEDVVTVLRSSTRRIGAAQRDTAVTSARELHIIHAQNDSSFRSIENLILNAEPLDQSPAVGSDESETSNTQNNTSVI